MKVPVFVIGSSLLLAAWLGITYVRTAPVSTYVESPAETEIVEAEEEAIDPVASLR